MSGPTDASRRIAEDEICIEHCTENDAVEIGRGLYAAFGDAWWEDYEPAALRPPLESTRLDRLANRVIIPSFSNPDMHWVKAVHTPTNSIMGVAAWTGPKHPLYSFLRPSASDYYNWAEKFNWTEADIEEMWSGVNVAKWRTKFDKCDEYRKEAMGDEPHWYLASLYVVPEFQGRGVSSRLLAWAIDQADKTDPVTPLYLESSKMGKAVYEHVGFVAVPGFPEGTYLRRGPPGPKRPTVDSA